MNYVLVDKSKNKNDDIFDKYTGLGKNSNGGTEILYRSLKSRIEPELFNKFQIVCSRFREFEDGKIPIFWLHDLWQDPEVQKLKDVSFRNKFKKFVFVSDQQFQTYNQGLGIQYSESIIIKNGIDPIECDWDDKPKDKINFIYHTTPHRGLEILVPVFIKLCEKIDNLHLDVFSSFKAYGWDQRDLPYAELFEVCKNHPNITYHGYQPNDVIREALKKSHIFAYPSIWKETSCLAAIEAMSAKNLVICPNYGALAETVSNYGYTYHWDENLNVHANRFAQIIMMALQNMNNVNGLVNSSSNRVKQLYNWKTIIPQWELLLKSLI